MKLYTRVNSNNRKRSITWSWSSIFSFCIVGWSQVVLWSWPWSVGLNTT